LLASLRSDPHYATYASPEVVARNRRLVSVCDALSLALCGGRRAERRIGGVATVEGETALSVIPDMGEPNRVAVAPWPFDAAAVTLRFEGRRRSGRVAGALGM